MSYRSATYVIFDGDKDAWAYRYMRGWKENDRVDFDFQDAHDLGSMTSRAENEAYVKQELRKRMDKAAQVLVLIGEATKDLYKFVRWEIELATEKDLPIIGVNLDDSRKRTDRCPAILRDHCAVFVPFKMKIIKHALDGWPSEYRSLSAEVKAGGSRYYVDSVYQSLGL